MQSFTACDWQRERSMSRGAGYPCCTEVHVCVLIYRKPAFDVKVSMSLLFYHPWLANHDPSIYPCCLALHSNMLENSPFNDRRTRSSSPDLAQLQEVIHRSLLYYAYHCINVDVSWKSKDVHLILLEVSHVSSPSLGRYLSSQSDIGVLCNGMNVHPRRLIQLGGG